MSAIIHKIREFLSYLVVIYFVFPILWGSYLVAVWGFFSLVSAIIHFKLINRSDWAKVALYALPFFLILFSVWLHPGNGNSAIEKSMSFIVFPVCVFLSSLKLDHKGLMKLIFVFTIGCLFLVIKGAILYLVIEPHFAYDAQHDFIFRYRQEFNSNVGIAPTYASMYFGFSIVAMLLLKLKNSKLKYVWLCFSIVLFANMLLLSAKMPILVFFFVMTLLIFRKDISLGSGISRRWSIMGVIGILVASVFFIFTRWNELVTGFSYSSNDELENSVGIRRGITQCGMELSAKHYLFGIGPQNVQKELNECYYQFEGNDFDRNQFNTHNQYVDYLISSGLIGPIVLLIILLASGIYAIKNKDPILLSFTLIIGLCMITENILSRHSGIIFYCFFNAVLMNRRKEVNG